MATLKRWHTYPLLFSALAAAGGNDIKSFQVETGFDFAWLKAHAFVYDANGLGVSFDALPRLGVILQDGSTQQNITTGEEQVATIFGRAGLPVILSIPHIIRGGQTLQAQVFNRHTVNAYSVVLSFQGIHGPVGSGQDLQAEARRSVQVVGGRR